MLKNNKRGCVSWSGFIIPALLMLFFTPSCSLFFDEGEWTVESPDIPAFNEMTLNSIFKVYYYADDEFNVEVHYFENLQQNILFNHVDSMVTVLNSFSNESLSGYRKPEIHIYAPALNLIIINEASGFFCLDTINCNTFGFEVHSDLFEAELLLNSEVTSIELLNTAGQLRAKGSCSYTYIKNKGKAKIMASGFFVNRMNIIQQSSMDATLYVTDTLVYSLIGKGDIILFGNPNEIYGEDFGLGELIEK